MTPAQEKVPTGCMYADNIRTQFQLFVGKIGAACDVCKDVSCAHHYAKYSINPDVYGMLSAFLSV